MKKFKRLISFVLMLCMVLSLVPAVSMGASAADSYVLVTDASKLAAGDKVVIVAKDYNYAISTTQNNNNRGQAAVTKSGNSVTFGTDVQVLTLEAGTESNTFALSTGSGYLYAASSSKNYLKTQTTLNDNGSWKISIASDGIATVVAQGSNSRNTMQYNQTDSLFACYASATQKAICIYKLESTDSVPVTITFSCPDGVSADPISTTAGTAVTLRMPTGSPANNHYSFTFYGWTDQEVTHTTTLSDVNVYTTSGSYSFNESTTLYALYTFVENDQAYYTTVYPITISFVCPDGVTAIEPMSMGMGTIFTLPEPTGSPANNVYTPTFVGWAYRTLYSTTTAPSYGAIGKKYYADNSITYYALYSYVRNNTTYYMTINPMTVSFSCPDGVSAETINTTTGTIYTIPEPVGTPNNPGEEYTFVGWCSSAVADTTTEPTNIISPGARYGATGDITYYAVYTYSTDGTTHWTTDVQTGVEPPATEYTVSFSTPAGITPPDALTGSTVTLPTLSNYTAEDGKVYTFLGWVDSTYDNVSVEPADILSGTYIPSANATLKALYTWSETTSSGGGSTGAFTGKESGSYVLAANVNGTYYAMSNTFASKIGGTAITVTNGYVSEADAADYVVTLTYSDDNYTISNGTKYLKYSSSTNLGSDSAAYNWKIAEGKNGSWRISSVATDTRGVVFRAGSSNQFGGYALSNVTATSTEYYDIEILPVGTGTGGGTTTTTYWTTEIDTGSEPGGDEPGTGGVNSSIKIITGAGEAWFLDSAGNKISLTNEEDDTTSYIANVKAATYRSSRTAGETLTLVIKPNADHRLSCLEKGSDRLTINNDYTYNSEEGVFTCKFDVSDTASMNFFRITFLPRLADGGYVAEQATEANEGDPITPGLYVFTGISGLSDIAENEHDMETTYLLYADEFTVLDDDMKAVGRKSSALKLSRVGVYLNTDEPYRMTAVNQNHLINIQPYGDTSYFTLETAGATGYYLRSKNENHLYCTTEINDESLWEITYLSDGSYKIVNKAYPSRELRFNQTASNLQFRTYATSTGHAPVLYRAVKASQKVTYSVVSGNNTGSIHAMNTSTASAVASGTYQSIDSVLSFSFTPAFGYMLEKVEMNGAEVTLNEDGTYTCTVVEGQDIDVQVSYKPIPATNQITVYFYVNEELQEDHTIHPTVANTYTLDLESMPEVPINGVNYKYSWLSFNFAENKTDGSIYSDVRATMLVKDGDEIHVYFTTTKVTLTKEAVETTDKNTTVDDTNGGLNSENFTDNNDKDSHGNVKQTFEITLGAQSFDKGEDIVEGNTDIIVVLDNSNSMHTRDNNKNVRVTTHGYLSARSSSADTLDIVSGVDNNAIWTISINRNSGVATITSNGAHTRNTLAYDTTNNVFSAYSSDHSMGNILLRRVNSENKLELVRDVSVLQDGDTVFILDHSINSENYIVSTCYMDASIQDENGRHAGYSVSDGYYLGRAFRLNIVDGGYTFYSANVQVSGATNSEYTMHALDSFYSTVFSAPGNRVGIVKFNSDGYIWDGADYQVYNGYLDASGYNNINYNSCYMTDKDAAMKASTAAIGTKEVETGGTNFVGAWLMTYVLAKTRDTNSDRNLVIVFFTDGQPTVSYKYSYEVENDILYHMWDTSTEDMHPVLGEQYYEYGGVHTSAGEYYYAMLLAQMVKAEMENAYDSGVSIHNIALLNDDTLDTELVDMFMSNDPSVVKQWNFTRTASNTTGTGYNPFETKNVTVSGQSKPYYTYGNLSNYKGDSKYWNSATPYADSYTSVTGNVSASLNAAFDAIAVTVTPGKRVNGTIRDEIPANFTLTEESEAALVNAGWTVTHKADGTTILESPVVTADEDGEEFTYEIQYQGDGYGVEYTNVEATYTYKGIEDGETAEREYTAYFPMPAVDVIPWTVNDGYTADTNVAVTLDVAYNDLFEELIAGGYTVGNLTVTLTDANGNPTSYLDAQVGGFDAIVDPASNTVSFLTEVGGNSVFYYVVSAEVTAPDGTVTTVYSRATRVDVLTVSAENVSDVDLIAVGESNTINLLENDKFASGEYTTTNSVILTNANGDMLDEDNLSYIANVSVNKETGVLTYSAVANGVEQFWYVNTITAKDNNGNTVSVSTPPTKVTILVINDAALVVDYGYSTESLKAHSDLSVYTISEGVTLASVTKVSYPDGSGSYGTATFSSGAFSYTPATMLFKEIDAFTYGIDLLDSIYSARIVSYEPTVTVVPANSIYFEESFLQYADSGVDLNNNALVQWSDEGTAENRTQSTENECYGYDDAYALIESYSGGSGKLATVTETNPTAVAYFTFSGTGFDLYGLSSQDTGFLLAEIYAFDSTKANNLGTLMKYVMVDTYIQGKTYNQLPILCCRDLDYGEYAVKLRVVYERAFDHNLTATKSVNSRNEEYYRQLLGLQAGIPMELSLSEYTAPATRTVPDATLGSYSIIIDGIRIYQPLNASPAEKIANDLYNEAGELDVSFLRIRDLLLNAEDWGEADGVSGLVYIAADKNYTGANDQNAGVGTDAPLTDGFYLTPTQVYKLDAQNYLIDANGDRAVYTDPDDGKDYEIYVAVVAGKTDGYRYEYRYDIEGSGTKVIPAKEIEAMGLMHACNYYEAVGPKYELYLINGNGIAVDAVGGSTVHISAKVPVGETADLMAYFNDAWVKVATVASRTELYFDITDYVNTDGSLILKCVADAGTVLSLCNIKTNGTMTVSRRTLCNAAVAINGNKVVTQQPTELVFENKSLSLQSYTAFNFLVRNELLSEYDSCYVIFERYDYKEGAIVTEKVDGVSYGNSFWQFEYKVSSYQMADEITVTLYGVKDGQIYTGETYTNSVAGYVNANIADAINNAHTTVYANLLNYGAKSQIYMGYNVENLADADLGEYKSFVTTTVPTVESIFSQTDKGLTGATLNRMALGISASVEMQAIFTVSDEYDLDSIYAEMVFVSGGKPVTQCVEGKDLQKYGKICVAVFNALTAVDGRTPVEITVYDADGNAISETWTYSVASYLHGTKLTGNALDTLYALINYYDSAAAYFNG